MQGNTVIFLSGISRYRHPLLDKWGIILQHYIQHSYVLHCQNTFSDISCSLVVTMVCYKKRYGNFYRVYFPILRQVNGVLYSNYNRSTYNEEGGQSYVEKIYQKIYRNSPCSCNGSHHNGSPSQCINADTQEPIQLKKSPSTWITSMTLQTEYAFRPDGYITCWIQVCNIMMDRHTSHGR